MILLSTAISWYLVSSYCVFGGVVVSRRITQSSNSSTCDCIDQFVVKDLPIIFISPIVPFALCAKFYFDMGLEEARNIAAINEERELQAISSTGICMMRGA